MKFNFDEVQRTFLTINTFIRLNKSVCVSALTNGLERPHSKYVPVGGAAVI